MEFAPVFARNRRGNDITRNGTLASEVVPGHVTTFAYLQDQWLRGKAGFEATVLTMNTRAATLFEGIANNAILIAHDEDFQIGVLLALLQDDAKNQSGLVDVVTIDEVLKRTCIGCDL